jgi:hypothetical protein
MRPMLVQFRQAHWPESHSVCQFMGMLNAKHLNDVQIKDFILISGSTESEL